MPNNKLVVFSCTMLCAAGAFADVVLAPNNAEVLVAPEACPVVRFAAADLTNHLAKVFGRTVAIVTEPTAGKVQIVVGDSPWTREAGIDVAALPRDAFRLKTQADRVYVAGRDDPTSAFGEDLAKGLYPRREHATAFGVCEFLERYAGVRFYFPDDYGTLVPSAQSIRVPDTDETVQPQFTIRNCYISGAGPLPDRPIGPSQAPIKALWRLRLRENTIDIPCCHGQNRFRITERFHATHPEYFQLRKNGTRCTETDTPKSYMRGQLCHTSKVWDIFRRETIERMRKGEKYVDIMPQDGMSACRCANCMARYAQTNDLSLASGFCTELMWSNTVSVADAVRAAGLDGCVTQMAYGPCRNIPELDIPDNVKVVLAVGGPWACSRPDILDKQVAFVRDWSVKLKGKVSWIWTYPMKNYGRLMAHDVPQHAPRAFFEFYKRTAPYIDGSFVESNQGCDTIFYNYLNYYVFAKLAWQPNLDVEALLAEHNRLMFGAAAKSMARFLDRLEEIWIGKVAIPSLIGETEFGPMIFAPSEGTIYKEIYTQAVLDELEGYLSEAARTVPVGTPEAMRVATMRRRFFDPLVAGRKTLVSTLSVADELARRKNNPRPSLLEGFEWPVKRTRFCAFDAGESVTGSPSIRIDSTNTVYVGLPLRRIKDKLRPFGRYRLSYFVKTAGLEKVPEAKWSKGATIEVEERGKGVKYRAVRYPGSGYWLGTKDWTPCICDVTLGGDVYCEDYQPTLWLRVFGAKGTVWFDGIRLEESDADDEVAPFVLDEKETSRPQGICGKVAPLERITAANAKTIGKGAWWSATAWRNERVNAQFSLWSDVPVKNLRCAASDLTGPGGAVIPASCLQPHFIQNVMARAICTNGEVVVDTGYHAVGDILGGTALRNVPANVIRPIWTCIRVPADAAPGRYKGHLTVSGDGVEDFTFILVLRVANRTLPDPKEWKPLVDVRQFMCTKREDGTWFFDRSVFDRWVTRSLGECAWQGLCAAVKGTADRNGFSDTSAIYPGGKSSVSWEVLRDSFENAEKIRILRASHATTPELEKALEAVDFAPLTSCSDPKTRAACEERCRQQVEAVIKALDAIR